MSEILPLMSWTLPAIVTVVFARSCIDDAICAAESEESLASTAVDFTVSVNEIADS